MILNEKFLSELKILENLENSSTHLLFFSLLLLSF